MIGLAYPKPAANPKVNVRRRGGSGDSFMLWYTSASPTQLSSTSPVPVSWADRRHPMHHRGPGAGGALVGVRLGGREHLAGKTGFSASVVALRGRPERWTIRPGLDATGVPVKLSTD